MKAALPMLRLVQSKLPPPEDIAEQFLSMGGPWMAGPSSSFLLHCLPLPMKNVILPSPFTSGLCCLQDRGAVGVLAVSPSCGAAPSPGWALLLLPAPWQGPSAVLES